MLGYEFPDTVLALTEKGFVFLTSAKKSTILESLIDPKGIPIQIFKRSKDAEENVRLFSDFFNALSKSFDGVFFDLLMYEKKMGVLVKESQNGKFITEYESNLTSSGHRFESVDVASGIAVALAIKDEEEMVNS